jgi:hypothetical protein
MLFRVSDVEASEALYLLFHSAALRHPPPDDGTEASFVSFWNILELLVPSGKSVWDFNDHTSTPKLRPDYAFPLSFPG